MSISSAVSSSTGAGTATTSSVGGAPSVTFNGLGSGLDINSIVNSLAAAEQAPLAALQNQQTQIQTTQTVYQALQTQLTALASAAQALSAPGAFSGVSTTSSNPSVATLTSAGGAATAGVYSLSVSQLATAQKLATSAQSDVTSALNQAGTFEVNGQAVNVVASDSLTTIAQKINGLNNGVTASLINGGTGSAYLTLTSASTGVSGKIQLSDLSGSVLNNLGVLKGAATTRESITNGITSYNFSSQTAPIASLTNSTTVKSSTVQINGVDVTINPSTDSLQSIATSINAANAGVKATVRSVTDSNNNTTYKLDLVGISGAPTVTDNNNVLQSLGFLQQPAANELVAGQDAKYTLDNVALTSSTNSITTAIPGATLTLLQGSTTNSSGTTTPGTTNLTMAQDVTGETNTINAFVQAFNGVLGYIQQNSTMDSTTFQTGPLFGDPVAQAVKSELTTSLFNNVPGLSGAFTNLTSIGFGLDGNNNITVNSSQLTTALTQNPTQVASLFQSMGTATNSNVTYVTSTSKTQSSGTGSYAVNITKVATQGSYTGEVAQTSASTTNETLTFGGALFAGSPYKMTVQAGSQASDLVHQINNDSTLSPLISASLDSNGKLILQSKRYGTNGNFTAVSNLSADATNSGLGVGSLGTTVQGVDVAGTINGEVATGSGQFLTGISGNSKTDGLQIQYTGTTTGDQGTMKVSKGVASIFNDLVNSFTDSKNGMISASVAQLQTQYGNVQKQINFVNQSYQTTLSTLQAQYAAMDSAISALKSQGNEMLQMMGYTTSSTGTSSSSSSTSLS